VLTLTYEKTGEATMNGVENKNQKGRDLFFEFKIIAKANCVGEPDSM